MELLMIYKISPNPSLAKKVFSLPLAKGGRRYSPPLKSKRGEGEL